VAAVPALAAVSAEPHPDAALLALWAEHETLRAECEVCWAEADAELARYKATRPPVPDVLLERPSDREMGLPEAGRDPYTGLQSYSSGVAWVQDLLDRGRLSGAARARAEEIVAAYDAWDARNMAALRAVSPEHDEDDDDEAETPWTRLWDLQAEIAEAPAATFAGLTVKPWPPPTNAAGNTVPAGRACRPT
jgi:hypothetical protein